MSWRSTLTVDARLVPDAGRIVNAGGSGKKYRSPNVLSQKQNRRSQSPDAAFPARWERDHAKNAGGRAASPENSPIPKIAGAILVSCAAASHGEAAAGLAQRQRGCVAPPDSDMNAPSAEGAGGAGSAAISIAQ